TTNARCGPGGALCHRRKVMTLTPSVRAISLCSFPCVANSSACANFVAISTLEGLFLLGIAACPIRPPPYVVPQISFCALGATQCVHSPMNGKQLSRCRINTSDCGRCVVRTYGMCDLCWRNPRCVASGPHCWAMWIGLTESRGAGGTDQAAGC